MMKIKNITCSLLCGLFAWSSGTANAADWTGVHVGAGLGAGAVVHELGLSVPPLGGTNVTFNGIGGEGIFFTIQAGADLQVSPSFVVGAFVDYDISDIETDLAISVPGLPLTANADVKVESQLSVGARVGWLPTTSKQTLIYASAGYTRVEFEDANLTVGGGIAFTGSASLPDFSGYFVGAGAETLLTSNIGLKLDYRFTQLGDESLFQIPGTLNLTAEPSLHTARVAVSYRFPIARDIVDESFK